MHPLIFSRSSTNFSHGQAIFVRFSKPENGSFGNFSADQGGTPIFSPLTGICRRAGGFASGPAQRAVFSAFFSLPAAVFSACQPQSPAALLWAGAAVWAGFQKPASDKDVLPPLGSACGSAFRSRQGSLFPRSSRKKPLFPSVRRARYARSGAHRSPVCSAGRS